ncbi:cytochrome b5-like [Typha angustifolia]|uniref:cytochrome b5-like n=1 Tax=Typha angustifolia TaxID=59011 RepID=UPI003C304C45
MASSKKYSPSEVSLHISKEDCWLIIHGKVYDVTNFLGDHPGGPEVLLQAATFGDATAAFEEVGHTSSAISMMEVYLIGSVGNQKAGTGAGDGRQKSKPINSSSLFSLLLPVLILGIAFGAWYYIIQAKA